MKKTITITLLTIATIGLAGMPNTLAKGGGKGGGKGEGKPTRDAASIFEAIDTDGDGSISRKELGESKRFADSSKGEVAQAFSEKDLNGNGEISQHEFEKTFRSGGGKGGHGKRGTKGEKSGEGKQRKS